MRAPNGGNRQIGRFLVVTDRARIVSFGALYHEAWWAKRRDEYGWTGPQDIPPDAKNYRAAAGLADHMRDVPCVVLALAEPPGWANSVLPACQNLMLAARALGIGSIPTTLHPTVMTRVYALFGIPAELAFHFCIPLGYPAEGARFGGQPPRCRPGRRPSSTSWGGPVPWTRASARTPAAGMALTGPAVSRWFAKGLGDALLAGEPLGRIEELFRSEYAKAGGPGTWQSSFGMNRKGASTARSERTSLRRRPRLRRRSMPTHATGRPRRV